MTPIQTTAVAEDESHLVLQHPLSHKPIGPVKVTVFLEEEAPTHRQLGRLEGKASVRIPPSFAMSDEDLLGM